MSYIGDLIEGYSDFSFDKADTVKIYNIIYKYRVRYRSCRNGEISNVIRIPNGEKKYFKQACQLEGVEIKQREEKGVPKLLGEYRTRIGILIGVFIFFVLIAVSENYVWRIDVSGNETVSTGDIIDQLYAEGLREGAYIPKVDSRLICNRILEKSENIAWVAINFRGNIARVEVIELENRSEETDESRASNFVSQYDALIESVDLARGESVVKPGQVVTKGDLLASGILEGVKDISFVRCEGEIVGRVTNSIEVDVEFVQILKTVKKSGIREIAVSFFSKKINIFKYSRNLPLEYDTIYTKEQVYLFGRFKLPVYIEKTEYAEYEERQIVLSELDAVKLATRKMNDALIYELRDGELLKTAVVGSFYDGGYKVVCTYDSLRNIAIESKLEISE